jgi:hypothetical protein
LVEDQELSPERLSKLEAHLDGCSDCRLWCDGFQSGIHELEVGVDKVSEEINELLTGSLDPGSLSEPKESNETIMAADQAAPRLAAYTVGVLLLICVVTWGAFPHFWSSNFWFNTDSTGYVFVRSIDISCVLDVAGEQVLVEPQEEATRVAFGQQIKCVSGACEIFDGVGSSVSITSGSTIIPDGKYAYTLRDGLARFVVFPGRGGLVVHTDEVTTRVLGTTFEVERWGDRLRSEIRVIQGRVALIRGERIPLPLGAGERAEVTSNGLMFHAARKVVEGAPALPNARLGSSPRISRKVPDSTDPGIEKPTSRDSDDRENQPLDLPVTPNRGTDPDGED